MPARPRFAVAAMAGLLLAAPAGAVEYDYRPAPGTLVVPELGLTAAELEDATLYNEAGEAVGEIDRVLVTEAGLFAGIGVEVGGFLGLGERDVLLLPGQLHLRDGRVTTRLSHAQLEAQPEYDD